LKITFTKHSAFYTLDFSLEQPCLNTIILEKPIQAEKAAYNHKKTVTILSLELHFNVDMPV